MRCAPKTVWEINCARAGEASSTTARLMQATPVILATALFDTIPNPV
jgi:hypothetical protein